MACYRDSFTFIFQTTQKMIDFGHKDIAQGPTEKWDMMHAELTQCLNIIGFGVRRK
jgi:hypothetical protein